MIHELQRRIDFLEKPHLKAEILALLRKEWPRCHTDTWIYRRLKAPWTETAFIRCLDELWNEKKVVTRRSGNYRDLWGVRPE